MTRIFLLRWGVMACAVLLVSACARKAPPPDLAIRLDGMCTTCDDYIRCDGGSGNAAVYDPIFDLYHLQPKGTAAQIATIWDFLVQLVRPKQEDRRPLTIHQQRSGETQAIVRTSQADQVAIIDMVEWRLRVGDHLVDQRSGEWRGPADQVLGQCRHLSREEGKNLAALFGTDKAAEQ
jgi:hypothetical protein